MRKVLRWGILIILIGIFVYTANGIYQESKIKKGGSNQNGTENSVQVEKQSSNVELDNSATKTQTKKDLNLVAKKYKGYQVVANLKIEKLNIDTCVLEEYTEVAANVCVTKFFGPDPNEAGNFCIIGHNYITKNMFGYLYQLKIGDILTLTDNKNGTVTYKIYDKYRAKPTETYRLIAKDKWKKRSYFSYLL